MANPITWRNVTGTSVAEAARPLAYAQQTMDSTFDRLNSILTQQQALGQAGIDRERDTASIGYREALAKAATPEEVTAMQQSGQLDTFLAQLDPKRRAALIGATEARVGSIQQNMLARDKFNEAQTLTAQKPLLEQGRMIAATGDIAAFNKFAAENPGLLGLGDLSKMAVEASNAAIKLGFDRNQDIRAGNADRRAETLQTDTLSTNAATRELTTLQKQTLLEQRAAEALTKQYDLSKKKEADERAKSIMSGGTMNTKEGMDNFNTMLKGITTNKSEVEDIVYNLNKRYPGGMVTLGKDSDGNPIKVPLPVQLALSEIGASTDSVSLIPWWSRRGDDAANRLDARLIGEGRDTDLLKEILRFTTPKGDADAVLAALDKRAKEAAPETATTRDRAARNGRYIPEDPAKKQPAR